MTGSALFDFVISIIALIGAGILVFLGIDFIAPDERFKKIGKVAVGLAFLILFLLSVKAVFFGGGGGTAITPAGIIEFAISLIGLLVVVYVIYLVLDFFASEIGGAPIVTAVKYVVGALALIVILYAAEKVILGGGLGMITFGNAGKRSELLLPLLGG